MENHAPDLLYSRFLSFVKASSFPQSLQEFIEVSSTFSNHSHLQIDFTVLANTFKQTAILLYPKPRCLNFLSHLLVPYSLTPMII